MVMFLMALCVAMFGLAVSAIAFSAATRDAQAPDAQALPEQKPVQTVVRETRFFAAPVPAPAHALAAPRVPVDVLLLQLERHVRLEVAAAESFLSVPTVESLHSRTASPLRH